MHLDNFLRPDTLYLDQVAAVLDHEPGIDLAVLSGDQLNSENLNTTQMPEWRKLTDVLAARGVAPSMEAEFVDGAKRPIVSSGAAANLVGELYRTAHSISLDYALKGKPPPT